MTRVEQLGTSPIASNAPRLGDGEAPYLQVLMADGKVVNVDSVNRVRQLLLDGAITRHNKTRWIESKPTRSELLNENEALDTDQVQRMHQNRLSTWNRRRAWRPIGEGIGQEEFAVRVLYDPVGAYMERGFSIGTVAAWAAFMIPTAIFLYFWDLEIKFQRVNDVTARGLWDGILVGVHNWLASDPKLAGIAAKWGMLFIALFVNLFPGMLFGWLIGTTAGKIYANMRMTSLPKPPNDGYEGYKVPMKSESAKAPTATKPCPCCGKPLRAASARQCFECGADWHGKSQ